jgi:hypothetical protein
MGQIGRIDTDFFFNNGSKSEQNKKNPCQSAQSAPSVLPLSPNSK